ncbi:Uncharacterized protein APZ42_022595 [Daphnia magna]|uniref:Uncharacterized protein n=1 Tax=Daphnia magna TaxID=35525 RepID=A0A0P5T899_9CRUS|nr:Uncharacterized protein APZ42_022595 [Daphnia magna]
MSCQSCLVIAIGFECSVNSLCLLPLPLPPPPTIFRFLFEVKSCHDTLLFDRQEKKNIESKSEPNRI